jgi:hypothetical protein
MQVNGCLSLSGSDYFKTATSFNISGLQNGMTLGVTFSFWFIFTGSSSSNYAKIFDFGNGATLDNVWAARHGISNNLALAVYQGSVEYQIIVTGAWPTGAKDYLYMISCLIHIYDFMCGSLFGTHLVHIYIYTYEVLLDKYMYIGCSMFSTYM